MTDTCTTCGHPADPHPYRHPITRMGSNDSEIPNSPEIPDGCTCPPGACHGGHTIDVGPASIDNRPTGDQLRTWLDPYGDSFPAYYNDEHDEYLDAMFAELLSLRARVTELEDANASLQQFAERVRRERDEARHDFAELEIESDELRTRPGRELEAAQREPIGFAVVRRPIGDGAAAVVWRTLDQARTAEGVASGYAIHPTVAEAISSVGRSDQPAGSDLVLVELREVGE